MDLEPGNRRNPTDCFPEGGKKKKIESLKQPVQIHTASEGQSTLILCHHVSLPRSKRASTELGEDRRGLTKLMRFKLDLKEEDEGKGIPCP